MRKDGANLIDGDTGKPFEKLRERSAILEVLEERDDRHPGTAEHPDAADPSRITLDRRASRPIDHEKNASTGVALSGTSEPIHVAQPSAREYSLHQRLTVIGYSPTARSIIIAMKIATGKVVEGKVVVEGVTLEEGSVVTVLTREAEGTFELTPEEEAELLLSIAEADRGETVSGEEVLESLPRRRT